MTLMIETRPFESFSAGIFSEGFAVVTGRSLDIAPMARCHQPSSFSRG